MLRSFLKYYLYWILFFLVQKPLFMVVNLPLMGETAWQDWLLVPMHAFPLDLSVASYVTAVFGLLLVVFALWPSRLLGRVLDGYTGLVLAVGLVVFIGDAGVFPSWGFHLDKSVLIYLSSPREVLACAEWWMWLLGLTALLVAWTGAFVLYRRVMGGWEYTPVPARWQARAGRAIGMLLLTGLLFLPMRGSLTTSTMNTGRVYFSEKQMMNIAAINPVFNIMESLSESTFDTKRYTYMPSAEAERIVTEWLPDSLPAEAQESLLLTPRPNIVLFILESFSLNAWEAMPALHGLAQEGVFFSRAVSSSYRTDRGVVAIMSGYPGQPTSSLMVQPGKSQHLPQLGKSLAAEGYRLKFWYGGDEDFTNMRSYLISGGFIDRVNDHSFPVSQRLSKWGVHDHLLFREAVQEICGREQGNAPTLDVILSLSSHEPFEVPATRRYEDSYLNSIAYTDSCIGAFVDSLRSCPAWSNTLLLFVADHGYPYPAGVRNYEPQRYAIPVVWAGGAVKAPRQVTTLCSQIDLVPTLLAQMGIDHSAYQFGKDVTDSRLTPFAFYSFNDGFAFLTDRDTVVVDAKADRVIIGSAQTNETAARAFVQRIMEIIDTM